MAGWTVRKSDMLRQHRGRLPGRLRGVLRGSERSDADLHPKRQKHATKSDRGQRGGTPFCSLVTAITSRCAIPDQMAPSSPARAMR